MVFGYRKRNSREDLPYQGAVRRFTLAFLQRQLPPSPDAAIQAGVPTSTAKTPRGMPSYRLRVPVNVKGVERQCCSKQQGGSGPGSGQVGSKRERQRTQQIRRSRNEFSWGETKQGAKK